jgi:response regulator RpfG family c-di-GMP phosphodiesterase
MRYPHCYTVIITNKIGRRERMGWPSDRKGDGINLMARIFAIANIFAQKIARVKRLATSKAN